MAGVATSGFSIAVGMARGRGWAATAGAMTTGGFTTFDSSLSASNFFS